MILQDSVGFCKKMQGFARKGKIMQDTTRLQNIPKNLQDSTRKYKIMEENTRYPKNQ